MTRIAAASLPLFVAVVASVIGLSGCSGTMQADPDSQLAETEAASASSVSCLILQTQCLSVLEAGEYSTDAFDFLETGRPAQLTYSVDDGWANSLDRPLGYWFRRAEDRAAAERYEGWGGVFVWGDARAAIQDHTSCSRPPASAMAADAASIAGRLVSLPGLAVTSLDPVPVDGVDALVMDIALAEGAPACSFADPFVPIVVSGDGASDPYAFGIAAGEGMRLYLVDVADRVVAIFIRGPIEGFDELLPEADTLIRSFRFASE